MPGALIVNPAPRKRRKGRKASKRRTPARRRNVLLPIANAGGRRRRRRNSIIPFSNPLGGGMVGKLVSTAIPALGAGAAVGFVDAKFLSGKSMIWRIGGKLAMAVGAQLALGKRMPDVAKAVAISAIGSLGYDFGIKMGGGVVATPKGPEGAKGLAEMVADDQEFASLLATELKGMGMGLLIETTDGGMSALDPDAIGDDGEEGDGVEMDSSDESDDEG